MRYLLPFIALLVLLPIQLMAAGPKELAVIDRGLWPYVTDTPARFDQASRLEIIAFAHQLQAQSLEPDTVVEFVGRKTINMDSVHHWVADVKQRLTDNFRSASVLCGEGDDLLCFARSVDWQQLAEISASPQLPSELLPWWEAAARFYRIYLYEQMRLAALNPQISSEIATLDQRELLGYELPDRQFLFTFDDGPTPSGGNSDRLISMLRAQGINATFFMLGERLEQRLAKQPGSELMAIYQDMCPASHGYVHKSHARLDNWQESVAKTRKLIEQAFPTLKGNVIAFRPPYGQRVPDAAALLAPQHEEVVLWNIDSQDWNRKISAEQTVDRVQTLMLLWRRGMILFHDIHAKAQTAVPALVKQNANTGVDWLDCHSLEHFTSASL